MKQQLTGPKTNKSLMLLPEQAYMKGVIKEI